MRESVWLHTIEEISDIDACRGGVRGVTGAVEMVEGFAVVLGALGGGVVGLGIVLEAPGWRGGLFQGSFGMPGW